MRTKAQKYKILLRVYSKKILRKLKRIADGYEVLFTRKFLVLLSICVIYIAFSYSYEYKSLQRESEYLVESLSKQVSYSITKVTDYLKINSSYYNNAFLFEVPDEHYLIDNLVWNTENFYSLDNMTGYTVYDYGNLTGFGTKDTVEVDKDEISTILYGGNIYRKFYKAHKDTLTNIFYMSDNNFSYVYPYKSSESFSYADLRNQFESIDGSTTLNGIEWTDVFVDNSTGKFTVSIYKDLYDVQNSVKVRVGILGVNLHLPNIDLLEDYDYYIIDDDCDILATNNREVTPSGGVKKFYDVKGTFEESNLIDNIRAEEQLFPYKDEIFSAKKIESTPYYFIISKKKYVLLSRLYVLLLSAAFVVFAAILILGEHDLRIKENKKTKKEIEKTKLWINQLKEESQIEHLTGIYNKGAVIEKCKELYDQRKQYLAVLIEIDQFKNFNESYGRNAGDHQLKYVAYLIRDTIGQDKFLGRWGGPKFIVLLENTDVREALNYCDAIRTLVEESYFTVDNDICGRFTVSCGIAEQQYVLGTDYNTTLNNVNIAVIEAKTKARNKNVIFK